MAFTPYARPIAFHWVALVTADAPELRCTLALSFADDPALPAEYPFPHQEATNNAGLLDSDANPISRAFLQINAGALLPASQMLPSSAPYVLDLLTEAGAPLLSETPALVVLLTEGGAALTTEAGVDLACAGNTSTAGAPLCTESAGMQSNGLAWFVAAQDYFLIRAEVPMWEDGDAGWLDEIALYYVPASQVPTYASRKTALWRECAPADVSSGQLALQELAAARAALQEAGDRLNVP